MATGIQRKIQNSATPKLTKELKKNALLAQKNQLFAPENQLTLAQVVQNITKPAQANTGVIYFSSSRFFGPAIPRSAQKLLAAAYIKEVGKKEACTSDGHFSFDKFKAHFENHENKNYRSVARHLKESYFKKMEVVEVGTSSPQTKNENIYFAPASTNKVKVMRSIDTMSSIISFLPVHEQAQARQISSLFHFYGEKRPTLQFTAHRTLSKTLSLEHNEYPKLNTYNWRELIIQAHITREAAIELASSAPKVVKIVSTGNIGAACKIESLQALALLDKIGIQATENVEYSWGSVGVIQGHWKEGRLHGHATFKHTNGNFCTGEWVQGSLCGQGTVVYANGHNYTGQWLDNQRHGPGVFIVEQGTYTGEWVNGQMQGQATFEWPNGDSYTALYQNNQIVGGVTFTFMNGAVYQGAVGFKRFIGPATVQFVSGKIFEGNFIYNPQLNASIGHGILRNPQNNTEEAFDLTIKFDGVNPTKITGQSDFSNS